MPHSVEPRELNRFKSIYKVYVSSEDLEKIDLEFDPIDYSNYEYAEVGLLDFSGPSKDKVKIIYHYFNKKCLKCKVEIRSIWYHTKSLVYFFVIPEKIFDELL